MPTRVFLTIDTELAWRHHAAGLSLADQYARSIEPAGVGIAHQLRLLADHGLKACFFVDPMPAAVFGVELVERIVAPILASGQEVQLHCHPNWSGARAEDRRMHGPFELLGLPAAAQAAILEQAIDWLVAAGCPRPIAFRAGSYAADDATIDALATLGIAYDSSHNGSAHPWPSGLSLPAERIAPIRHRGVIEVPVTVIETPGQLRHVQVCAISVAEMRAALDHAVANDHAAFTIVAHGFELANRTGSRANGIHKGRFASLCAMLAERAAAAPTTWFRDSPPLPLDRDDAPLAASRWRTAARQASQLWSNLVEERKA